MQGKEKATTPLEEKDSFSISGFLIWPLVAVVMYVLSTGPLMRLAETKYFDDRPALGDWIEKAYSPLEWAYEKTPMHKPLGMYFHLWTDRFDSKGDQTD